MAYQSNVEALWSRNQALEQELAAARNELQRHSPNGRLQGLRELGRNSRERWIRKSKKAAARASRREALRDSKRNAKRCQKNRAAARRATSRFGWLASPAVFWFFILLSIAAPLFMIVLFIMAILPLVALAVLPAVSIVLHFLGRLFVARSWRRCTGWRKGLGFPLTGWKKQLEAVEESQPSLRVVFVSDIPNRETASDLLFAAAEQRGWMIRGELIETAEETKRESSSLVIPMVSSPSEDDRRGFYLWSRAVIDDVVTELHRSYPVAEVKVN